MLSKLLTKRINIWIRKHIHEGKVRDLLLIVRIKPPRITSGRFLIPH